MFYKIGQVAKIFGLSPNALRHYEKLGMIHPQVDPETNFRYYEPKDIVWLLLCKGFYSMGFSIKETVELAYHMDYQKALDCLSSRRDSLHQELEALTDCCQRMDRVCQNWESSRAMVGRCQVTFRPAYWKLDLFNGHDAFSSGESSRLVQQWLDHMPHVRAVCSFPLPCLRQPGRRNWTVGDRGAPGNGRTAGDSRRPYRPPSPLLHLRDNRVLRRHQPACPRSGFLLCPRLYQPAQVPGMWRGPGLHGQPRSGKRRQYALHRPIHPVKD